MKKRVVIFSGAGVSAESGLKTFRDSDGLWEGYRIEDVATPEAWRRDPERVLQFYNERRESVRNAQPNAAHIAIARLEGAYPVTVITQNIDDLHERAGSSHVIHLHGEILQARSVLDDVCYSISGDIRLGDTCPRGGQLRPHVVWFGEAVPMMEAAAEAVSSADVFIVVGTSLAVYPAAGLVELTRQEAEVYYIDPKPTALFGRAKARVVAEAATLGVPRVISELRERAQG